MKYTIEGFSQQYALSLKREVNENGKTKVIKIDCTDLLILRWFVDFYPNMKRFNINGSEFAWVNYQKLLDDMPLMNIGKQMLFLRLQKMVSFGILTHHTIKNSCGTYSCYGFGSEYANLISDSFTEITDGIQNITDGVSNKLQTGSIINYRPNNSSTIPNSSTIQNSSISIEKTTSSMSTSVDPQPKVTDVVNLYHEICKSYPRVRSISDNRRKAINARLRTHSMDEIREVFEKAEKSSFLKGSNKRNWSANFDWLMNDTNFCKVLDGNYDDRQQSGGDNDGTEDGYLAEVEAAFRKCEYTI